MLTMNPFESHGGCSTPSLDNYEFTFEAFLQDSARIEPDVSCRSALPCILTRTHMLHSQIPRTESCMCEHSSGNMR